METFCVDYGDVVTQVFVCYGIISQDVMAGFWLHYIIRIRSTLYPYDNHL